MARKVQVLLVDDLDGGAADETVSFALDGASYKIDLSSINAKKLRDYCVRNPQTPVMRAVETLFSPDKK